MCARSAQGLRKGGRAFSPALYKVAQGPQGLAHLTFIYKESKFYVFISLTRVKLKKPCGPCAANNDAAKRRNDPCADLAQTLRKERDGMPQDAFERFRRLRGVASQANIATIEPPVTPVEVVQSLTDTGEETAPGTSCSSHPAPALIQPEPLTQYSPCAVCGSTDRWNDGDVWRCRTCWPSPLTAATLRAEQAYQNTPPAPPQRGKARDAADEPLGPKW
jgi:hypothetical protein